MADAADARRLAAPQPVAGEAIAGHGYYLIPSEQEVADLRSAAVLAKPPEGGTAVLSLLLTAFDELAYRSKATQIVGLGLVVHHRGYPLQLIPDVENRGWSALGMPDATDENGYPLQVTGDGPTPLAALDACAEKCYEAEDVPQ